MFAMHPIIANLPSGTHSICSCGDTAKPPICDESAGPLCRKAHTLTLETAKTVPICACGRSGAKPICDGSHGYEKGGRR